MPCLLVLLILAFPRIVLACLWFFTTMLDPAFHREILIPLLGFIFLPITTIVYAWLIYSHLAIAGTNLIILIVAVVLDVGSHGSSRTYYGRRS